MIMRCECARLDGSPCRYEQAYPDMSDFAGFVTVDAEKHVLPLLEILYQEHYVVILHTCILGDFSHFAHLYFSRCAMRERCERERSASASEKNREKSRNRERHTTARASLAHRSRSLRSRSLAHREKYRCAATKIA